MHGEYMKLIRTIKRTVGSILVLQTGAISKNTEKTLNSTWTRDRSKGRVEGVCTLSEMTTIMTHYFYSFALTLCSLLHNYTKSAVLFAMYSQQFTLLLPNQKLLVFTFKICLRHHFLVVHPLPRKILDPLLYTIKQKRTNNGFCNTKKHPKCL